MTQYKQIEDMMQKVFFDIRFYIRARKDNIFDRTIEEIFHVKEFKYNRGYMNNGIVKDIKNIYRHFNLNYSNKTMFSNQTWSFTESEYNLNYKMYITAMPNKNSRVIFDILNFLTEKDMLFEIGSSLKNQNTNIVIHLDTIEDANRLHKYLCSNKEYYNTMIGSNIPILPFSGKIAFIKESNRVKRTYLELCIGYLYTFIELMTLGNRSKECNPDYFIEYMTMKTNKDNIVVKRFTNIRNKSLIEEQKKLTK